MFNAHQRATIEAHQQGPAVDVVKLALAFGLEVWEVDLGSGVSGKLCRTGVALAGASGFAIFVNRDDSPVRRRFTIAHELGHFLLHRKLLHEGDIVDDGSYSSRLSNDLERQADEAAAEILMPWSIIERHVYGGTQNTEQLAAGMRVSEAAIRIRLKLPV